MNKTKIIGLLSFILTLTVLFGCGKSDKNVSQNDTKKQDKQLDTSKFYAFNNLQYWQNYPGKSPQGEADMAEVKDTAQINKIKKAIAGETKEDVYTCEMHPQVHQNYMGKCPLCKMDLTKQEKKSSSKHIKTHEDLEAMWQGKPNAIHKELKVPDAKCENYKKILEDALSKDKGILDEVIDLDEHIVHMYLDKTKTNIENIQKLIQAAGFDVGDKKADTEAHKNLPGCGK